MKKKTIIKILVTSLPIFLSIVVGLILWSKLPDKMPIHWGVNGEVDGWASKPFAVFGFPAIMFPMHVISVLAISLDSKNIGKNEIAKNILCFIVPIVSVICSGMTYSQSFEIEFFSVARILPLTMGVIFIIIGSVMAKLSRNNTIGIKIKWTLESDENWNATHRFASKIWCICGFLVLTTVFLPENIIIPISIVLLSVIAIVPIIYSYIYSKKH